jgi:hypothetical protein
MKSHRNSIVAGIAVILVALLYPTQITVAPDWTVRVVDENGAPLAGVWVSESWQHYSVEKFSHAEESLADPDGTVHFPRRTLRVSRLFRMAGCLYQFGRFFAHASCGPHASVMSGKCGYGEMGGSDTSGSIWAPSANPAAIQSAQLVLHHCPVGATGLGCLPDSLKDYPACRLSLYQSNPAKIAP